MENNIPRGEPDDHPENARLPGDNFLQFARAADLLAALDAIENYPFDDEYFYRYTDKERR